MALTRMAHKDLVTCLTLHPSLYILGLNFRDFFVCVLIVGLFLLLCLDWSMLCYCLFHIFRLLLFVFKHLQYFDLLNIFEINGFPSQANPYLFNGDFVDRGSFSLEVILTLFAFKCMCPSGTLSVALRYQIHFHILYQCLFSSRRRFLLLNFLTCIKPATIVMVKKENVHE